MVERLPCPGNHTVTFERTGTKTGSGTTINIDAVDVRGVLR